MSKLKSSHQFVVIDDTKLAPGQWGWHQAIESLRRLGREPQPRLHKTKTAITEIKL